MSERARNHKITIDAFDWENDGNEYVVTITVDEAKLAGIVAQAIQRHDGRKTLGDGLLVVEAKRTKAAKNAPSKPKTPTPPEAPAEVNANG